MARWIRNDGHAPLSCLSGTAGAATPSGMSRAVQGGFAAVAGADGGRPVVDFGGAVVTVPVDIRQAINTVAAALPPGGRKRQRSSPEWAETASRARFAADAT